MQSIVHILKNGPLYWRSNHSHCPKQSFETLLSQCLTFITLDNLESTILLGWQSSGHVLPSPLHHREQQCLVGASWTSTLTSLWPAYEPMGCTGNIAWHLLFFQKACLQCRTILHSVTLWPRVKHCYSLTYGADLRYSCDGLSNIVSGLIQAVHRDRFLHVSGHTLGSCGNCAWSSHSATDWSTGETARGQNYPTKVGVSSR